MSGTNFADQKVCFHKILVTMKLGKMGKRSNFSLNCKFGKKAFFLGGGGGGLGKVSICLPIGKNKLVPYCKPVLYRKKALIHIGQR